MEVDLILLDFDENLLDSSDEHSSKTDREVTVTPTKSKYFWIVIFFEYFDSISFIFQIWFVQFVV